jgi:hypothetical protein
MAISPLTILLISNIMLINIKAFVDMNVGKEKGVSEWQSEFLS